MIKSIKSFYNDPQYFPEIWRIAMPIIIQQFMFSALNMIGVILVGQKGEVSVAAVGLANQVAFLLNLVHFGIISGAAMFSAQFWGKRDIPNLRRILGLCLILALSASFVFWFLSQYFSAQILNIYSKDAAVISAGTNYLRIFAWTFIFYAITFSYSFVLRSTGDVKKPTYIAVGSLILSTFLSYGLILGKFGLPELGIDGVAISTLIARALECIVLLVVVYSTKDSPVAARLNEMFNFDMQFLRKVVPPIAPVILNELFWALGITAYMAIYGNMGTASIATINILSTIEQLAIGFFVGLSNATSVLVGNFIGAGEEENAYLYAGRSLGVGAVGGILMGCIVALIKPYLLTLYKVSPEVILNASYALVVVSFFMWIRINNMVIVIGILRAGGDTKFSLFLDGIIIWLVGVPMAYMGAFVFHLPVYFVYLCAMSEEVVKWILGLYRWRSRKWINNLTHIN